MWNMKLIETTYKNLCPNWKWKQKNNVYITNTNQLMLFAVKVRFRFEKNTKHVHRPYGQN